MAGATEACVDSAHVSTTSQRERVKVVQQADNLGMYQPGQQGLTYVRQAKGRNDGGMQYPASVREP